ncbi:multiple sugar transport system permease protein [Paenibacillus taihuensis]|uniref:Multiple sugar transport system permease protein n=1 Tax=Paenibacillus taihuensis TaxID=1156355 RepID=A0A3D9R2D6_9BACL|nr:carbohydrate ABC transporter permease [Paenibacillus taihuensis]REE69548.1 multiple sugar transport system permease protein [Paenibacillus taihuensis]
MSKIKQSMEQLARHDLRSGFQSFMQALRGILFGTNLEKGGLLGKAVIYFLLVTFAVLYLEPLVYMISTSFKGFSDFTDPTAKWIPKDPTFVNLKYAFDKMNIKPIFVEGKTLWQNLCSSTLFNTATIALPSAAIQVFTCAIAGYAFGRLEFPFKKTMLVFLVLTYIVPPNTVFIPLAWIYKQYNLLNSPFCFIAPAIFGQGLRSGLFIIIYMQFFRKIPKELEEAAALDGIGSFRFFWKIMFPLAKPAMITVFLFSLVWHWNETYLSSLLYTTNTTLSVQIAKASIPPNGMELNLQPVQMVSGLLFILPNLLIYLFTQRLFTESIERTGIVE